MRILNLTKQKIDDAAFKGRVPTPDDYGTFIDEPTLVYVGEKLEMAYIFLEEQEVAEMRRLAKTVKLIATNRSGGIPTKSAVFGAVPRVPLREDYCRFTKLSRSEPGQFAQTLAMNELVARYYEKYFPERYAEAMAEVEGKVHKDWRYSGTPFLTCNINVNHAIKYHRDTGNMKALSNVLILKEGIEGGHVVLPEFGITISQRDRALVIFDGQGIMHGVTPIRETGTTATPYRASIVYYTLQQLCKCLSKADEVGRLQQVSTTRGNKDNYERKAQLIKQSKKRLQGYDSEALLARYKKDKKP